MKIKNEGKVYSSPATDPILSTLQLLPPTVLSLASLLPPQDIQVLYYLLACSLHHSATPPSSFTSSSSSHGSSSASVDCDCFDCYTVYWLRWDSSPNRDLIHHVIDAFEDHLSSSSSAAGKSKVGRRRGKDRNGGRGKGERSEMSSRGNVGGDGALETRDCVIAEREKKRFEENANEVVAENTSPANPLPASPPPPPPPASGSRCGGDHKGLARKVLPDLLGILNSRLWNLWNPDV